MNSVTNIEQIKNEIHVLRARLGGLGATAAAMICIGAVFYRNVENLSWLDAFYFCTITLTTVGYGDITPTTNAGKLFAIFYVIIGIGIIAAFANQLIVLAATRREFNQAKRSDKNSQKK